MAVEPLPPSEHCWIEVSEVGINLVLRIGGELDRETCGSIEPALMAAVVSARSILIDLARVTFCDSTGLATLIATHEKATANGAALAIRHVPPKVQRLFEITGTDEVIEIVD
jgi:anti-anti-sigma factor